MAIMMIASGEAKAMTKASGRQIALLLLLVLTTSAAAEITGTAKERANPVPCSADGCGDCWCCLPPAIISLRIGQVAKTDDCAKDIPPAILPSLPALLSPPLYKPKFPFFVVPSFSLLPFHLSPRAPPACG